MPESASDERRRKPVDGHTLEISGVARRDRRAKTVAGRKERFDPGKIVPDFLRMRRTDLHALPACHARILYDTRLRVHDADCLHGTVPHALVAVLAFVLDGVDW